MWINMQSTHYWCYNWGDNGTVKPFWYIYSPRPPCHAPWGSTKLICKCINLRVSLITLERETDYSVVGLWNLWMKQARGEEYDTRVWAYKPRSKLFWHLKWLFCKSIDFVKSFVNWNGEIDLRIQHTSALNLKIILDGLCVFQCEILPKIIRFILWLFFF